MNKIVLTIVGIFIAIALVVGLYNYSIILEVKEDTTRELYLIESTNAELTAKIDVLESKNAELAKNISLLESTNTELAETTLMLKAKTDVLEEQQQSLLQEEYDFLLFSRDNMTIVKSGITGKEDLETTKFSEALQYVRDNGKVVIFAMGSYDLDSEVIFESKSNMILDGQ